MVAAKRRADSVIMSIMEDERPTGSRGRWSQDSGVSEFVKKVLSTADTNKAIKARVAEAELIAKIAMHLRHHATQGQFRLHTQNLPDGWLRAWVTRVKETVK